jgi:hypothetical protein
MLVASGPLPLPQGRQEYWLKDAYGGYLWDCFMTNNTTAILRKTYIVFKGKTYES